MPITPALAAGPEILLSAVAEPTGDPDTDTLVRARVGELFSLYAIVTGVDESISGWELGVLIRYGATLSIVEVRSAGDVLFDQNSIGTVGFAKSPFDACTVVDGILVEIVFELDSAIATEVQLIGPNYGAPKDAPFYVSCEGTPVNLGGDRTPIRIELQNIVATSAQSWSGLKASF
jgi:hypothetical protein